MLEFRLLLFRVAFALCGRLRRCRLHLRGWLLKSVRYGVVNISDLGNVADDDAIAINIKNFRDDYIVLEKIDIRHGFLLMGGS